MRNRTLNRYIAGVFAARIAMVLVGLLAILQIMDVIGESNRILSVAGAGEADLWRYVQLRLPILATQFMPFAVLLATLLTFGTLAVSSQIVTMRAMGLSPHQILMPMLMVAAGCAALHLVWNETLTVRAAAHLSAWQATNYGANPVDMSAPAPETWVALGDTVIRARPRALAHGAVGLDDVAIFKHVKNGGLEAVTLAERGFLSAAGKGELYNLRDVALTSRHVETLERQSWRPGMTPAYFFDHSVNPDHVTFFNLAAAASAVTGVGKDARVLNSELYHKLARPLASLLMPLLGAMVAFGLARTGNVLVRAAICLGLGFLYFIVDNIIMAMGRSGVLPATLAAGLPLLLFLMISEAILFRSEQ